MSSEENRWTENMDREEEKGEMEGGEDAVRVHYSSHLLNILKKYIKLMISL